MTPAEHVVRKMRYHLNKVATLQQMYESVSGRKTVLFVASGSLVLIDLERFEDLEDHPSGGRQGLGVESGGAILADFPGGKWDGG